MLLLVTENLNEKLNNDIKKCLGKVFVLVKNMIVNDIYTVVIQQEINGSIYYLITRTMKLPNKILEVTTNNNKWKDNIKQGLNSFTSNISPIVLIKTDLESPLQIVRELENIKCIVSFR